MIVYQATILLSGFEVETAIGIHDFERAARQRLIIDVELRLTQAAPPADDDIAHVLDYDFLRTGILALVRDRHYDLQETLAHAIAALCLEHAAVAGVTVMTRKPDVYPDCASVGFRLHADRG